MLHRLIALFFILTLAGQVLAGVCVCLDETSGNRAKTSCCLRKKAQASMKKKSCCTTPCGEPGDRVPGSQSESSVKIPINIRKAVENFVVSLAPRAVYASTPTVLKRDETASQKISKPPILYLQNHAFLI